MKVTLDRCKYSMLFILVFGSVRNVHSKATMLRAAVGCSFMLAYTLEYYKGYS